MDTYLREVCTSVQKPDLGNAGLFREDYWSIHHATLVDFHSGDSAKFGFNGLNGFPLFPFLHMYHSTATVRIRM